MKIQNTGRGKSQKGVHSFFLSVQVAPAMDQYASVTDYSGATPVTHYYNQDDRLSVRNLTDSTGAVSATYDYTAMGEATTAFTMPDAPSPVLSQRYRYTGRELNPNGDAYYFRYRNYSAGVGAFTARDTL